MRRFAAAALVAGLACVTTGAQAPKPSLASPNAAGVSMGHLHYRVRDVAANQKFWMALGGQPVALGPSSRFFAPGRVILRFHDVLVVLDPGDTTGGTEGSVVNHVAFRIPSLAPVEAAGLTAARLAQFPGVSSVMSPENEHGPLGGDELNILKPGANYGWPLVTYGTDYDGTTISALTTRPDLESPFIYWVPSIAVSGIAFYTGDRLPAWKGNVFVGSMFAGRTRATGHLVRITFNKGRPIQREPILAELKQRIRDVRQGPDGLLYVLTDEPNGTLLKIEPAS